nr:MAG TPA: hypothetical protein [Caudoviricetes sp.]
MRTKSRLQKNIMVTGKNLRKLVFMRIFRGRNHVTAETMHMYMYIYKNIFSIFYL